MKLGRIASFPIHKNILFVKFEKENGKNKKKILYLQNKNEK